MRVRAILLLAGLVASCGGGEVPDAAFPAAPLTTVESRDGKLKLAVFTAPEQPPSRGNITAKFQVTDRANGAPVDGLQFDIVPEMPSMGHGTPTVPRVSAKGDGTYLAEDVDLFMAGRWDLVMTITGKVSDAAVVTIDVR